MGDVMYGLKWNLPSRWDVQGQERRKICRHFFLNGSSGPRHIVFAPEGKHACVITEMAGEIVVFSVNQDRLEPVGHIKLNSLRRRILNSLIKARHAVKR